MLGYYWDNLLSFWYIYFNLLITKNCTSDPVFSNIFKIHMVFLTMIKWRKKEKKNLYFINTQFFGCCVHKIWNRLISLFEQLHITMTFFIFTNNQILHLTMSIILTQMLAFDSQQYFCKGNGHDFKWFCYIIY